MKQITKLSLITAGIVLIVGGGYPIYNALRSDSSVNLVEKDPNISQAATANNSITSTAPSFNLGANLSQAQRIADLEKRSQAPQSSLDRSRSRYVLANIYLSLRRPSEALTLLTGLENEYPVLAEYILLKRSQALAIINPNQAGSSWNQILSNYPQGFAAAEALNALGRSSEVLTKFPSHPRARVILKAELAKAPNRFDLLAPMAVYFKDDQGIIPIFNRLVSNHSAKLTSAQWSAIAQGYFDRREYAKANLAYPKAVADPDNLYLWGRSLQRTNRNSEATSVYNRLIQSFPSHPLAPRAILRMMDIASANNELANVNKLSDRLVSSYPNTASEGLLKKLNLQDKLRNNQAATTRNQILSKYPRSDEAGTLTWRVAEQQAKNRNFKAAIAQTQKIIKNNPEAEIAAKAGYWGGKWAKNMGESPTAQQKFQTVIRKYPDSYYAWRSAVQLGWQVGDFTTLRNMRLSLTKPDLRTPLPSGSAILQELYLLGQDQDASDRWQFETKGQQLRSPKQIFTDGVIRVGVNDNLRGLNQIESMYWLDVTEAEQADIKNIIKQPTFAQTLYPFPYKEPISRWANIHNLPTALVIGLIRQESRFESQIVSSAEAIGLMQVIPETGAWIASKKKTANYSLRNPEQNIEFGTWYLDYTHSRFNNNTMLAIASYNAGPGRVSQWVNSFGFNDPDEFVEKIPYDETRGYVEYVLANYWNYLRLYSPQVQEKLARLATS